MTLGQWYHILNGLDVGKYHTKFQLSSPEVIKVISCKRNADIFAPKLAGKLGGKLEPGYECDIRTYAYTDIISWQNAKGRRGHKTERKVPTYGIRHVFFFVFFF